MFSKAFSQTSALWPSWRAPGATVAAPSASSCCHRIISRWVTRQSARDLISNICEREKSRASMGTDLSACVSNWSFMSHVRGPCCLWALTGTLFRFCIIVI
ncbi:hypothetical protein FQN60_003029 [Etheostoma spectabile]|uniref:Uncharacterized protein n=1 Tax=Etheostoma spectabile TaxID=54343 RepID=A0A5J5CHX7_9PERO|nr:hypothetical protein FQN60_003029 [Etheostoma spectabile]